MSVYPFISCPCFSVVPWCEVLVVRVEPLQQAPLSRWAWKQFFLSTESFAACVMPFLPELLAGTCSQGCSAGKASVVSFCARWSDVLGALLQTASFESVLVYTGSPECLCRAVRWGSWSQCFGVIRLERGLGKGKGTTCSCVMKRAQVGSCPLDLSSIQVSGFNPSYWMALGSSSWVLYFCSWKQSSEASGTLCGLSTGSYTEARISNEINRNP